MRVKTTPFLVVLLVGATVMLTSLTVGQERWNSPRPRLNDAQQRSSPADPATQLLDQRRQQLTDRLRHLRRAEETLGPRHPSLAEVRLQIAEVQQELSAWALDAENPFTGEGGPAPPSAPLLDAEDLRLLVLRMATKIEDLESRVSALERGRRARSNQTGF